MELALAIVTQFSGWLALAIGVLAVGIGIALKDKREHEYRMFERKTANVRQMFELETERAVKLSIPPVAHDGPQLEHRTTDRNEDGKQGDTYNTMV